MEELTELTEGRQGPGGSDRAPSPAAELAELKGRLAQERPDRWESLPDIHIVCGLSNISFGLPKRALINRTFLVAAMTVGLDSAIMDPLNHELMASLYAANAVLGKDEYCIEYLGAYREELL